MNSNTNHTSVAQPSAPHPTPLAPRTFSNRLFWTVAAVLALLAVLSRFWALADKPFHHDESLHAYYSHNVANGGLHKYDALLHGPFLYYFVGMFQFIAKLWNGDTSDFVARFPAALFGVLVVLSPLLVRRLLGNVGTLVFMSLFLISPSTWYFGRFLREDVFTSIWVIGTLFGVALARTAADDRMVAGHLSIPGTSLKTAIGDWLPGTPKTVAWCFASAMLAFHFTNKENSYLHTALWVTGGALVWAFDRVFARGPVVPPAAAALKGELHRRIAWCVGIFAFIFTVLFSGFFRHPDGWWNGVLDGLYRKSLVYWWNQDQQRRIDGPFDYHLPILANYEFLLLPFLATAWFRILALSRQVNRDIRSGALVRRVFFASDGSFRFATIGIFVLLVAATFLLPRLALVAESCGIADIPCNGLSAPRSCHGPDKPLACLLHISHTRHFLQIVSYVFGGGIAFLAAIHARRKIEAFLWFWLTGALGTYSYVGEKVPWLIVYILIPLLFIAGIELTRILTNFEIPAYAAEGEREHNELHSQFSRPLLFLTLLWLGFAAPFTAWKGWRVSFPNAANPDERLVFTQTTPEIKLIRDRMQHAAALSPSRNVRIGMEGEATWPFAWYVQVFRNYDFIGNKATRIQEIKSKPRFDALFLNDTNPEEVHAALPDYNIYRVPLRAWWVPKPNPTLRQIFRYFFFGEIYPPSKDDSETGKGATSVLYLESQSAESPFATAAPLTFGKLIIAATPGGTSSMPPEPAPSDEDASEN